MLALVSPAGLEMHFRDAQFSEPAKALTLPQPAEEPDMAVLEEMAKDLASYGTEVVGSPGPPPQG